MPAATLTKRSGTYDETQFDMPRISQGKTVLWYPDRHVPNDSYTAFVTRVGDRSIDLSIMRPDSTTLYIRNGVRHRNDPDGEIIDRSGDGVWDFPEDQDSGMMLNVVKTIKALADRVERLEKK